MKKYKILSWNVNGLRAAYKKGFLDWFNSEKPDIMCLQETKAMKEQLAPELQEIHRERHSAPAHSDARPAVASQAIRALPAPPSRAES